MGKRRRKGKGKSFLLITAIPFILLEIVLHLNALSELFCDHPPLPPRIGEARLAAPRERRASAERLLGKRTKKRQVPSAPNLKIRVPNGTHCLVGNAAADESYPEYTTVKGERHSATNLARQLLSKNGVFPTRCSMKGTFFDCDKIKHGFFRPDAKNIPDDVAVVVMVRDVFSWLISMFYEPYSMVFWEGADEFGSFIRSNYSTPNCFADYADCAPPVHEAADNLVQLRTKKYRNWVDYLSASSESAAGQNPRNDAAAQPRIWSLIRQEDLVGAEQQELTMLKFFDDNCLRSRVPFKAFNRTVTRSGQSNFIQVIDQTLQQYTLQEMQFVLSNLDLEFERDVLGYDHSKIVEQHTAKRISGELNYTGPPRLKDKLLNRRRELIQRNLDGTLPGRDVPDKKAPTSRMKPRPVGDSARESALHRIQPSHVRERRRHAEMADFERKSIERRKKIAGFVSRRSAYNARRAPLPERLV